MEVQLINLGRNNINKTVYPRDLEQLRREISRVVMHDDWSIEESPLGDDDYYVVKSMNVIGTIKIVNK